MVLDIAQLGQPVLRQVAAEIAPDKISTPEFQSFLDEMRETLAAHKGAGLAAPQVFASVRVFLAGIWPPTEDGQPTGVEVFINPRLVQSSGETRYSWEGCLSFPELLVLVGRPVGVRMEYLNEKGEAKSVDLTGFPARVVQHELDHLDGILTLDRAPSTRHIIKASELDAVLGDSK